MSSKVRTALITSLVTLLVAVPAAVWAGHQFTDVPSSNIFHEDIQWMADNGVTKGCNPPDNDEYCPDDNVTREQMAAFMHRLETEGVFTPVHDGLFATATRAGLVQVTTTGFSDVTDMTTQVTVPSGRTGVVVARFNAESDCDGPSSGQACGARLLVDGTPMAPDGAPYFDDDRNGAGLVSHSIQRVSNELGPGTYTVQVEANVGDPGMTMDLYNLSLVAEVHLTD